MLFDGAIMPATVVLIPEVGRGRERPAVRTVGGCRELARRAAAGQLETLVILITSSEQPRLWLPPGDGDHLRAEYGRFGADELNHLVVAARAAAERLLAVAGGVWQATADPVLPEAALTVLYYLRSAGARQTLVLETPATEDGTFEPVAGALRAALEPEHGRSLVVAAGNLSSRLFRGAPGGYHPEAPAFDEMVVRLIEQGDLAAARSQPVRERAAAGETLLPQIALMHSLLGEAAAVALLSYEAPFGEGYLTAWLTSD